MAKTAFQRLAALTLACVCLGLVVIPFLLAGEVDLASRRHEEVMVRQGLTDLAEAASADVERQAAWDEAVRNLETRFDADWAAANIGGYFGQTAGFDAALVLDPANQTLYAMRGGQTVRTQDVAALASSARDLNERLRHPGRRGAPSFSASDVRTAGSEVFMLSASLVHPELGQAQSNTAPVIVTARSLTRSVLADIARRYSLEDVQVALAGDTVAPARAVVPINDDDGQAIAFLSWRPAQPGATLIVRLGPILLVSAIILLFIGLRLYSRSRDAAARLVESEARASRLAFRDSLTGLANRAVLADRMAAAIEELRRAGRPFAIHCLDLDGFKEVNDSFGHEAGDELIAAVADRLSSTCRPSDTLARLGGDEFALIQTDATPEKAAALADRLVRLMAASFATTAGHVFVGCSVGVAFVGEAPDEAMEGMRQADLALYRAKALGKGRYCFFEPGMDATLKLRQAIKSELRAAIETDSLDLVYQPQVDRLGLINGVEALVRWSSPLHGPLSPAVFVPIAEEAGLAVALGEWIIGRAFEQGRELPGLKVAVNLSSAHVRSPDFCRRLSQMAHAARIDARQFEFEISEDLLAETGGVHEALRHIRELGFGLTLDDFGIGPLSFQRLKRSPICKVKIDRSFVTGLGCDAESDAVVSAIIRLSQALGLSVVAKGVETDVQRLRLHVAGCSEAQGFLFGRPVALAQIRRVLERREGLLESNTMKGHANA